MVFIYNIHNYQMNASLINVDIRDGAFHFEVGEESDFFRVHTYDKPDTYVKLYHAEIAFLKITVDKSIGMFFYRGLPYIFKSPGYSSTITPSDLYIQLTHAYAVMSNEIKCHDLLSNAT